MAAEIKGLILCSKKKILWVESHDLSQAENEITACKADQIYKMTPLFTQNYIQGPFWLEIGVILWICSV